MDAVTFRQLVNTMPRKHIMTAVRCEIVTMKRVGTMAFLLWSMEVSARHKQTTYPDLKCNLLYKMEAVIPSRNSGSCCG
jgi:hypothetical protein